MKHGEIETNDNDKIKSRLLDIEKSLNEIGKVEIRSLEKRLNKLESDSEIEYANIRSNYFLTIFILLAFVVIEQLSYVNNGLVHFMGYDLSKLSTFIIISAILVVFNIKNIHVYTTYLVKRYVFKIKK